MGSFCRVTRFLYLSMLISNVVQVMCGNSTTVPSVHSTEITNMSPTPFEGHFISVNNTQAPLETDKTNVSAVTMEDIPLPTEVAMMEIPIPITLETVTFNLPNLPEFDPPHTEVEVLHTLPPETFELIPVLQEAYCPDCLPSFTGGEALYTSMVKWTSTVCGGSVCNISLTVRQCGSRFCDECYCDEDCFRYGDCCPDKLQTIPLSQVDHTTIGCFPREFFNTSESKQTRYKMVGRCPKSSDSLTSRLCEEPDSMDLKNNIPVYSKHTQLHYRNIHCAICHQATDRIQWEANSFCDEFVDFSKLTSRVEILELLRQKETCIVYFVPPAGVTTRNCYETGFGIDKCNVTGQWKTYDEHVEKACGLISQPVQNGTFLYRNIFCAFCNGVNLDGVESCSHPIVTPTITPFSVLLDVRPASSPALFSLNQQEEICSDTQVFDPESHQCRQLFCPAGKIPENHQCESLFRTSENLGYIVHFMLSPKAQNFVLTKDMFNLVYHIKKLIQESEPLFSPKYTALSLNLTYFFPRLNGPVQVTSIDIQYAVLVGTRIPREIAELRLLEILTKDYWWLEPLAISPVYFDVTWLSDLSSDRIDGPRNFFILPPLEGANDSRLFFFKTTSHNSAVPSHFLNNVKSYIQVNPLMFCNRIELNSTEFTLQDPRTVILNHKNQTLKEGEFLWNEDRIQVCTNFTGQKKSPDNSTDISTPVYDQTEVMLTLICTCLSLCGLAITLLIYLVMPTLRTLPGRNNMFLFSNLFLAQLLFLTGSAAKVSLPACRALGVIIHYFWLSTFCWKLICAFHMYRLFTNPLKTLDQTKTLIHYIIFGQLTPCAVIGLVILINTIVSGMSKIGYAERPNLCFLSGTLDVALGFVTPVVLVVLLNVFFFSRVVYELRSRPKIQRNTSKSDAKEFVLYFKMSLILGFTWIVGFLALIINNPGLWYVFTVINASVGLFVLFAFGLKNLSFRSITKGRYAESRPATNNTSDTYETKCSPDHVTSLSLENSPCKCKSNGMF